MEIEAWYQIRGGVWDSDSFELPDDATDDEINQRLDLTVGEHFGQANIRITKDGKPYDR